MITSTKHFVSLAVLVGLWYLGLTYLPPVVGTCLSTGCGDDVGAVARSIVIPLAFFTVPILLETVVHGQSLGAALATLGLTRFSWTGIALALVPPELPFGTDVTIDVRGAHLSGRVVPTPFIAKK